MGGALTAAVLGFVSVTAVAHAQRMTLADGSTFASPADYYPGTWKWERPNPRQTAITRFGGDGSFFFHNFTTRVQQFGRFVGSATSFTVTFEKTCYEDGARCQSHDPPRVRNYPFEPVGANLFKAGDERWERQKSQSPSS